MTEYEEELYAEAVPIITGSGKASISLLQRRMRIAFGTAHRLMSAMEARGVVSPANTLGQRTVLNGGSAAKDSGGSLPSAGG